MNKKNMVELVYAQRYFIYIYCRCCESVKKKNIFSIDLKYTEGVITYIYIYMFDLRDQECRCRYALLLSVFFLTHVKEERREDCIGIQPIEFMRCQY